MNKYLLFIFLLGLVQIVYGQDAQNKDKGKQTEVVYKKAAVMRPVRQYMKAANYSKVLDEIKAAYKKHEEARRDPELYSYQVRALEQLALVENRNMYLATRPDTAKYFNYLYDMYAQALICDSLESQPDLNGKVEYKYRYDVANTILKYRKNLKVSCKYFYKKKDYTNAYKFVEMYCKSKSAAVFTDKKGVSILPDEDDKTELSVIGVLSAFGSQNNSGVVKYLDEALNDSATRYKILELGCKAYLALGDTVHAVKRWQEGFQRNPSQEYFFMSLVKYYDEINDHDSCRKLASEMVTKFSDNRNYWFIKANEEEALGMYDEALLSYGRAIELKADDAEAYSSVGNIHSEIAHRMYLKNTMAVTHPGYREFRGKMRQVYMKAKEAYENARKYAPENKALWQEGLRNTYFRLNMGRELKDLEKQK